MEAFISFILGAVVIFYLFGIVFKLLIRYFISKKFKQFTGGTSWQDFASSTNQQSSSTQNEQPHREGEVFISKTGGQSKKVREKVGEYVDFEEVK